MAKTASTLHQQYYRSAVHKNGVSLQFIPDEHTAQIIRNISRYKDIGTARARLKKEGKTTFDILGLLTTFRIRANINNSGNVIASRIGSRGVLGSGGANISRIAVKKLSLHVRHSVSGSVPGIASPGPWLKKSNALSDTGDLEHVIGYQNLPTTRPTTNNFSQRNV